MVTHGFELPLNFLKIDALDAKVLRILGLLTKRLALGSGTGTQYQISTRFYM